MPGPPKSEPLALDDLEWHSRGPEDVTRRLLSSALIVFGERGFDAATVSDVARRCGLTTGAIYARWATKRELFEAVIEHASSQRMLLLIKSVDATPAEKLALLGANLLTTSRNDTRALWLEACMSGGRDGPGRSEIVRAQDIEAEELVEIVTAAKESGIIDPSLSTDAIVFLCQSLGLGTDLAMRVQGPERPRPPDEEWAKIIARLIDAFGPKH